MAHRNRLAAATALAAAFSLAATPATAHGYNHWHGWHHDHVDAGEVVAGVAVVGALAAIASAAANGHHHDQAANAGPIPDGRQGHDSSAAQGDADLDRLADSCVGSVERGQDRVDYVDNVSRDGSTWVVSGAFQGGAGFSCRLDNDGQVLGVSVAGPRSGAEPQAAPAPNSSAPPAVDNRPIWRDPADNTAPQPQEDGRYSTSQAPDFTEGAV